MKDVTDTIISHSEDPEPYSKVKWSGLVSAGIGAEAEVRACSPGAPCSSLNTTAQELVLFVIVCSYKTS